MGILPCLRFDLLIGQKIFVFLILNWNFVMTKAVSNREICFIKAVLLLCKHWTWAFKKKSRKWCFLPPPKTIRVLTALLPQKKDIESSFFYKRKRLAQIRLECEGRRRRQLGWNCWVRVPQEIGLQTCPPNPQINLVKSARKKTRKSRKIQAEEKCLAYMI